MVKAQLTLLEPDRLTAKEAGLAHHVPNGPAKLLAELVKRGLKGEHLEETARFLLAWDAHAASVDKAARAKTDAREARADAAALAPVDSDYHRVCACGCLRSLDGRRATVKYFGDACRVKALRARKAATPTPAPKNADVTVPRLPRTTGGVYGVSEAA